MLPMWRRCFAYTIKCVYIKIRYQWSNIGILFSVHSFIQTTTYLLAMIVHHIVTACRVKDQCLLIKSQGEYQKFKRQISHDIDNPNGNIILHQAVIE